MGVSEDVIIIITYIIEMSTICLVCIQHILNTSAYNRVLLILSRALVLLAIGTCNQSPTKYIIFYCFIIIKTACSTNPYGN